MHENDEAPEAPPEVDETIAQPEPEDEASELEWLPIPVFDVDPDEPPRARVVGSRFLYSTDEDGTLDVSVKVSNRVLQDLKGLQPREQMYVLLRSRGEDEIVDRLEDLDLVDSNDFIGRFWQAFQERQEARLGESLSSSAS